MWDVDRIQYSSLGHEHLARARAHAAPWVQRRLTGRSSGDPLNPKYPTLDRPPVGAAGSGTI